MDSSMLPFSTEQVAIMEVMQLPPKLIATGTQEGGMWYTYIAQERSKEDEQTVLALCVHWQ